MTVKNTVKVWATASGKQSFETDITTPSDPTSVTPKFGLTAVDDLDGPPSWTAGAWSGSYDTATEKTTAVTPTIGATAASPSLSVVSGNRYWVWAQVTLGGEVWTEPVGEILVP